MAPVDHKGRPQVVTIRHDLRFPHGTPYSEATIGFGECVHHLPMEFSDGYERAFLALNIAKITPDHGHHLRVYPAAPAAARPYARLIDPSGVVDLGQRTFRS